VSPYYIGKLKSLPKFRLHAARRNLCCFLITSRGDTPQYTQHPMSPKTSCSSKGNWKWQNTHSEGGRFRFFDKSNQYSRDATSSRGPGHGNSALRQKRKLPPREQKKKDY
jgi:hypothetical protein